VTNWNLAKKYDKLGFELINIFKICTSKRCDWMLTTHKYTINYSKYRWMRLIYSLVFKICTLKKCNFKKLFIIIYSKICISKRYNDEGHNYTYLKFAHQKDMTRKNCLLLYIQKFVYQKDIMTWKEY